PGRTRTVRWQGRQFSRRFSRRRKGSSLFVVRRRPERRRAQVAREEISMQVKSMSVPILFASVIALTVSGALRDAAAANPYAAERDRSVKALSPDETADLTAGHGMG